MTTHPQRFRDDDPVLARVRPLALAFPGAAEKVLHGRPVFHTDRTFGWYGGSQKVDGVWVRHGQALLLKPEPGERDALLERDDGFVPAYLGPRGWVGLDLSGEVDWDEVAELLEASYRLTAPRRLVTELDSRALG